MGEATLNSVFEAWSAEQDVSLVVGSQGGSMIPLRVRVEGPTSECMLLGISLHDADGEELRDGDTPLRFYPQDDGSLLTETHYVFIDGAAEPGSVLTLSTTVGTESAQHTLHVVP